MDGEAIICMLVMRIQDWVNFKGGFLYQLFRIMWL